jgi:hypothetical protein
VSEEQFRVLLFLSLFPPLQALLLVGVPLIWTVGAEKRLDSARLARRNYLEIAVFLSAAVTSVLLQPLLLDTTWAQLDCTFDFMAMALYRLRLAVMHAKQHR